MVEFTGASRQILVQRKELAFVIVARVESIVKGGGRFNGENEACLFYCMLSFRFILGSCTGRHILKVPRFCGALRALEYVVAINSTDKSILTSIRAL